MIIAYKLMKVDADGRLHFPFCDTGRAVGLGCWMRAEDKSVEKDGRRFAPLVFRGGTSGEAVPRPGFHLGEIPYAPHIGIGGTQRQREHIGDEDVWVECEVVDEVDWQQEADRNGMNKSGKVVRSRADIRDRVPFNGFYRYRTNHNMPSDWIIAGDMRMLRVMYDDEVAAIAESRGLKPMPRLHGLKPREWTDGINRLNGGVARGGN